MSKGAECLATETRIRFEKRFFPVRLNSVTRSGNLLTFGQSFQAQNLNNFFKTIQIYLGGKIEPNNYAIMPKETIREQVLTSNIKLLHLWLHIGQLFQ